MVNWNSRSVSIGMMVGLNLMVVKVIETKGVRKITLRITNLPDGFEAKDIVVTVPASQQDNTLAEANQQVT